MLAYLFWHRPRAEADKAAYEKRLVEFHDRLSRSAPPGFVAAGSFAIGAVPWLGGHAGYEDWCLLEGTWAMDPLNAAAISGAVQSPHDSVAALMDQGHGGLYTMIWGDPILPGDSTITWLTRPRGIQWRTALEPVRSRIPQAQFWRRQMVLGPAPEFAISTEGGEPASIPDDWHAFAVKRSRLGVG
jgi:hypothetical protein